MFSGLGVGHYLRICRGLLEEENGKEGRRKDNGLYDHTMFEYIPG
jgi:hypothetical protein